jgi:membrane AbrB-like protein
MNIKNNPTCHAVVLCALGGFAAQQLHIPLPWMIGSMLAMALAKMSRVPVHPPRGGREVGQTIVASAIGLFFTPAVLHQVANIVGLMLLAGAASILIGYLSALPVARLAGVDRRTAFFASVPGGASEMVQLGTRYGAAADFVAMAQSLRLMLVVLIIPPLFAWSGASGSLSYAATSVGFAASGLAILFLLSGLGGLALMKMDGPTPWFLGPLLCSIAVSGSGHSLSSMPPALSGVGQCLMGCALGARFDRDFLARAPRLVGAAAIGIFLTMLLSALLGCGIGMLSGMPVPSMILATAPGGIAEMGVTAKVLGLGVPLVTAFHVTRLLILLTMTSPIFRATVYLNRRAKQL